MPTDAAEPESLSLTAATAADTTALAATLATLLRPGDLVGLTGELGAGKTHFVRGLARGLGLDPRQVSSPTFVLLHEYATPVPSTPGPSPTALLHLDLYRLGAAEELDTLGWGDAGAELREEAVVAVEWADRFPEAMGDDWLEIELAHSPDQGRTITLTPHGSWTRRMAAVRQRVPGSGIGSDSAANRAGADPHRHQP